jgi:hypothetical protein
MIQLHDADALFEEVAFIAYHFGWSHDEVLEMPHWERQRWCEEISSINERLNEQGGSIDPQDSGGVSPGGQASEGGRFLDADDGRTVLSKSLDELGDE